MLLNDPEIRDRSGNADGGESGHLLMTLMVALMVMAIFLGVAFQQWSIVQRRDLEHELIFRGNQYVNAILAYRTEHGGALPLEIEALYRPGPRGLRYIRKLYKDPFDRKGEGWGLLYLGPGGKWVFDPQAAARGSARAGQAPEGFPGFGAAGLSEITAGFGSNVALALQPTGPGQTGFPAAGGAIPGEPDRGGALGPDGRPAGSIQGRRGANAAPVNQIVGVVSRSGEKVFYRYTQRDYYWDWQFHIFAVIRDARLGIRESSPIQMPGGMGPGGDLYSPQQEQAGQGRPKGKKNK